MKKLSSLLPLLRSAPLRDHLWASGLATGLFVLIFAQAIFGGHHYGELPQQQSAGVVWQYPRMLDTTASVTERQPNVVDADYHFLYELDAAAAAHELRAGHLPYFDYARMLGVPLWGSVIFDFGNPLNLLLAFFSIYGVHLIKVLVCMLLAANGFLVIARELGGKTFVAWMVPAFLYLGSNFALYYIHWIGAYGITCIAPLLLGTMLRFLRTGSAGAFLGVFFSICFVVVAHCTHIAVHLMILCGVACVATFLLSPPPDRKLQLQRLSLLVFAGICAAVACFEILWQVQQTSVDSGRIASKIEHRGYPIVQFPTVPEAYSTYFFGNIPSNGSYWEALFMPWAAVLCLMAVFTLSRTRRREMRVVGWLLVFFLVFFFIGFLDAPLYLLLGKLYAPNPMAWRGLLNLYLPIAALAGLGAEMILLEPAPKLVRTGAGVGLGLAVILGLVAALVDNGFVRASLFGVSGMFYDNYIHSLPFWLVLGGNAIWLKVLLSRQRKPYEAAVVVAGAAAVCLGMAWSRVPTYPASEIARVTRGDPADINTPRLARLLPGTEYLLGAANVEMRYAMDSPLSTLGLKMLNGYHTSLSKPELKVFDALVSEEHLKARGGGVPVLRTYSFGFYRTFLDGRAIVKDNRIRPNKALILRLLGVEYMIDGVGLSRIDRNSAFDFSKWPGVNLPVTTAAHLVEGMGMKEVLALFSDTLDAQSVNLMQDRLRPLKLEPTADDRGFQVNLAGTPGTIVVPYHFGRFFKVTLDGRPVSEPEGWGLCVVEVTGQSKRLEIRPLREGILARTFGGLVAGCLLALLGCGACQWLTKSSSHRRETQPSPPETANPTGTPAQQPKKLDRSKA